MDMLKSCVNGFLTTNMINISSRTQKVQICTSFDVALIVIYTAFRLFLGPKRPSKHTRASSQGVQGCVKDLR